MRGLIGAAAVALAAAGATAQEAVTYKAYAYKVGDKTRTTKTEETTTATTIDLMGQVQKKDEKKTRTVVYTTEVLAVGPDPTRPAKVRRVYEKAEEEKGGATTKLPLDGRTVVAEKTGAAFTITVPAGDLPADAAAALDKEFNKKGADELFPKTPVKPGDTWDRTAVFLDDVAGPDGDFGIDRAGAKVTGKLLAVAKKDGATVGEAAMTANLPLTELRAQKIKLNPGSVWTIDLTGTGPLDGSSPAGTSAGAMRFRLDGEVMGAGLKVNVDAKLTSRTERVGGGP